MRGSPVLLAFAVACGQSSSTAPPPDPCTPAGGGASASSAGGLLAWSVNPQATDACITTRPDSHFVYVSPTAPLKGRLFVFLPGSGAIAQNYRLVVQEAARAGYHAIGLTYVNDTPVGALCAGQPGTCYGDARREILTGEAVSGVVSVDRPNSIENRLLKLVAFMQAQDPARGWGQFAPSGALDWSKISVAGHSQGGGHALYIAQRHVVFRATAFASAGDLVSGQPAPWVAQPFATPASRIFGFISELDELVDYQGTIAAWTGVGLGAFGAPVRAESSAPPYGGTHMLSTVLPPRNPGLVVGPNHNVSVVDVNTPLAGGVPTFAPAWGYLAFPD